jgi:hypothetical protein
MAEAGLLMMLAPGAIAESSSPIRMRFPNAEWQ